MAQLKFKDIQKMSKQEREKRLKTLKTELIKSKVDASKKGGFKTKEIKKMIARILTFNSKHRELKK